MWEPTELERLLPANSLWEAMAGQGQSFPALEGEQAAEVVIVGGGITGLSTAIHLAERGVEAVVVEAAEIGWGASGRNGGQVIPGLKEDPDTLERLFGPDMGPRTVEAVGKAPDLVFSLIERYAIDCGARRCGWIQAAHSHRAMTRVEGRARAWQRRGAPVEVLGRDEAAHLLGTDAYVGGLLDRRGGALQPLGYTRGLAETAVRKGARIFVRSRAVGLRQEGERWHVGVARGAVVARRVVLATNGYTDRLWPGLAETILPVYSFQVATRPLCDAMAILPEGHVVSDTRRLLRYYRRVNGRLVIGGRGPFRDAPAPADDRRLQSAAREMFKGAAAEAPVAYRWSGRVALTADHLPHLHELAPAVFAGLGFNGRGVAMGTLMGKWLAELARGGRCEDFPVTAPRPVRAHALHRPVLQGMIGWYRLLDGLEARLGRK
jgi:glycine/D-amino acid oxidase-like deaminating enzyme